jgi:hypothetical protein
VVEGQGTAPVDDPGWDPVHHPQRIGTQPVLIRDPVDPGDGRRSFVKGSAEVPEKVMVSGRSMPSRRLTLIQSRTSLLLASGRQVPSETARFNSASVSVVSG